MFLRTIVWAAFKSLVQMPQACRLHFLGYIWQLHKWNEGTRPSFILAASFTHDTCSDVQRYALNTSHLSPEVIIPKDKENSLEPVSALCANLCNFVSAVLYFPEVLVNLEQVLSVSGTVLTAMLTIIVSGKGWRSLLLFDCYLVPAFKLFAIHP